MNLINQAILRSSNTIRNLRCISLSVYKSGQTDTARCNFVPVYLFPYIRPLVLINRLKIYQTALTVASIPGAVILNQLDYVSNEAVIFTGTFSLSGCITFYSLGYLTSKFIGFIYYDEERDVAKVSYIDFWGRRKDIEVPKSDIVPINELPVTPFDGLFLTFRRFSTKETLRLNIKLGIILDKDKIKKVL